MSSFSRGEIEKTGHSRSCLVARMDAEGAPERAAGCLSAFRVSQEPPGKKSFVKKTNKNKNKKKYKKIVDKE